MKIVEDHLRETETKITYGRAAATERKESSTITSGDRDWRGLEVSSGISSAGYVGQSLRLTDLCPRGAVLLPYVGCFNLLQTLNLESINLHSWLSEDQPTINIRRYLVSCCCEHFPQLLLSLCSWERSEKHGWWVANLATPYATGRGPFYFYFKF